jgi:hypothetical protein
MQQIRVEKSGFEGFGLAQAKPHGYAVDYETGESWDYNFIGLLKFQTNADYTKTFFYKLFKKQIDRIVDATWTEATRQCQLTKKK